MSESKWTMAKKLAVIQENLMGETIKDTSLDGLLSLIFKVCRAENMCFWFQFYEHEVVLNLRDTLRENYELNIRQYYETAPKSLEELECCKKIVLINTFLIINESVKIEKEDASSATNETLIISGDKPVPQHIRDAIKRIQDKGIPVTPEAIHNHLPLGQMSTSARMECNKYLKQMEGS